MTQRIGRQRQDFEVVLDCLLAHGNTLVGERWRVDKEGWHAELSQPIDWPLLYAHFRFDPDEVQLLDQSIATIQEAFEIVHRPARRVA